MWRDKLFLAADRRPPDRIGCEHRQGSFGTPRCGDYKNGQYMTLEPLVVHGKVMVGWSGGEFGVRGYHRRL